MALQSSTPELENGSDPKVAEQLVRILASRAFRQADRLKRFLTFIVEETVAGRGERLKEFVVGVEVFGKPESFDPRNDPIVRVQARRLRAQLTRYYREQGQDDPLVIELPKGGYSPIFRTVRSAPPKRSASPALVSRNTVMVLPFADHSPAGDQKYFCQGIREEIVLKLTGLGGIRLVAWDPAPESDAREAADRHNAALIVSGSVRLAGSDARITTNLVDTATGCYLWSGSIDRKLEKIFEIQEEVAQAIAEQLTAELAGGTSARGSGRPTENLAAYNLYVQGRYHLNQRTEEGLRRAVEFFDKAIVEDAQYAQAYSGLADAYSLLGHYGVLAPAEVWTKAASNAAWAVLQNEHSAEAHTSLAHVKATQDWDWAGAEREFQRAIGLDPRYSTARHWHAVSCLAPMGRLDEALDEIQLAQALDPISSIIARDVARVQYYRGDFDAALDQCDHTIELNPHFSPAYWTLGLVQEQRGDFDESAAAFQRALQLSPRSPIMQAALGRTFALSGKRDDAVLILRELHKLVEKRYVSPLELASCHFALDQTEQGFEWLSKAFQDRCFELISIRADPRWQSLRRNPRFQQFLNQLGLP
jgi:serine/threonine-protein kinase